MKKCNKCGRECDDDAKFCITCGNKLEEEVTKDGIRIVENPDPLFRVKCEYCYCVFEYRKKNLGFRLWYPHGFVYCPKCNKPLRHKLEYMVDDENT